MQNKLSGKSVACEQNEKEEQEIHNAYRIPKTSNRFKKQTKRKSKRLKFPECATFPPRAQMSVKIE